MSMKAILFIVTIIGGNHEPLVTKIPMDKQACLAMEDMSKAAWHSNDRETRYMVRSWAYCYFERSTDQWLPGGHKKSNPDGE